MSNVVRTFTDPSGTIHKRMRGLHCTECGKAFQDGERALTRTSGKTYKHDLCPGITAEDLARLGKERLIVCSFPSEFIELTDTLTALNYGELVRLEAAIEKYGARKYRHGRDRRIEP